MNKYVPASVGVPEIDPSSLRVKPAGRSLEAKVMPSAPLAVRVALYAVPTVPEANNALLNEIAGASVAAAGETLSTIDAVVDCAPVAEAVTVIRYVPA